MSSLPVWIDLDGAENVRDLAGLPAADGRVVQPHRLIRSDSLQELTDGDVRHLVDDLHVTAVADLRSHVEVAGEGPGPLTREASVDVEHLSLFPESGAATDAAAVGESDGPVVLPWQDRESEQTDEERRRGATGVYLRYLDDRADSIVAALRLIAGTEGATIVNCAAGKDRTGTVVAIALTEVGVERAAVVADYGHSAERVERVYARLGRRRTYAADLAAKPDVDKHKPREQTMVRLLAAIDETYGGVPAWLRSNGWTEADAAALRAKLLD